MTLSELDSKKTITVVIAHLHSCVRSTHVAEHIKPSRTLMFDCEWSDSNWAFDSIRSENGHFIQIKLNDCINKNHVRNRVCLNFCILVAALWYIYILVNVSKDHCENYMIQWFYMGKRSFLLIENSMYVSSNWMRVSKKTNAICVICNY